MAEKPEVKKSEAEIQFKNSIDPNGDGKVSKEEADKFAEKLKN